MGRPKNGIFAYASFEKVTFLPQLHPYFAYPTNLKKPDCLIEIYSVPGVVGTQDLHMKRTFKLVSIIALVAATSTSVMAQPAPVPVNATVAGATGATTGGLAGAIAGLGVVGTVTAVAIAAGLAAAVSSSSSGTTTTTTTQ